MKFDGRQVTLWNKEYNTGPLIAHGNGPSKVSTTHIDKLPFCFINSNVFWLRKSHTVCLLFSYFHGDYLSLTLVAIEK